MPDGVESVRSASNLNEDSYSIAKASRGYLNSAAARVQSAHVHSNKSPLSHTNMSSLNIGGGGGGGSGGNGGLSAHQLRHHAAMAATTSTVRMSMPSSYPLEFTPHVRYLSSFKKMRQTPINVHHQQQQQQHFNQQMQQHSKHMPQNGVQLPINR